MVEDLEDDEGFNGHHGSDVPKPPPGLGSRPEQARAEPCSRFGTWPEFGP